MTRDDTLWTKEKDLQRAHELKLKLLEIMAKDPDMKYFVGVALGAGVASISSLFSSLGGGSIDNPENPKPSWSLPSIPEPPPWFFLFGPGIAVTNVGIASWLLGTKDNPATMPNDPIEMVAGVMTLASTGFAGFCAAILILKAIFGEQGLSEVLKGIGEIVPG